MSANDKRYNVSHKQEKVIAALISSRNVKEAHKVAGISSKSMYRLLNDPEFMKRYKEARTQLLNKVIDRLTDASHLAIDTLVDVLKDPKAKHFNKISAAKCILECSLKGNDFMAMQDLSERLERIERGEHLRNEAV